MEKTEVICECFNVTYEDVEKAVKNGAKTFEEVQEITKVGTGCEGCKTGVMEIVAELLAK